MKCILLLTCCAHLWACTVVEGDRILGLHLPGFPRDADLGPSPVAGARRVFQPFELERLARKYSVGEAPRGACFERAIQVLTAESILPLLTAAFAPDQATIEILDFSKNELPLGTPEFPRDGLSANGFWRGRLIFGANRSAPIWARVRITDATSGKSIAVWRHSKEPDVVRGEMVRVAVLSGGVMLAFEAPAESSGHSGEAITVRNPANGKRFRAIVEAKGKVSIHP
jgi:hypothetical protein